MRCDTEVFYDLFELNHIRMRHSGGFVGICPGFDLVFDLSFKQTRQHQR